MARRHEQLSLEEFANLGNFRFIECVTDEDGHGIGYEMVDHPDTSHCGFGSRREAVRHWIDATFGRKTANELRVLLPDDKEIAET